MKTDSLTSSFVALRDKLHRSALAFLRNEEDASDALQETFCRLWQKSRAASEAEAKSLLFLALKNVCIDNLRRRRYASIEEADSRTICMKEQTPEDLSRLESLLTTGLTDLQRRIYSLYIHHNLDYDEIASRLEMSEGAVRTHMCRIRKRLSENRKKLDL